MQTLRLRKVLAQDHVARIQKSKEVCRMMRPDLPSPTQNVAQILQDNVLGLFFFKQTASRAPSQTQSQISRGAAQKPAFPRECVQGSMRPGRPLLSWLGVGTGPYCFPFAERTSPGPSFLPAFAQTAPSALPQHCQALPLANSSSLPRSSLCRAYLPSVPPTRVPALLITVVGLSL